MPNYLGCEQVLPINEYRRGLNMEYAQITNGEAIQVTTHGNVEWDSTHYCPARPNHPNSAT